MWFYKDELVYIGKGKGFRWDDGSYWNNYNDWACSDKRSKKWVIKKPKD
jgi:hypothetical protein